MFRILITRSSALLTTLALISFAACGAQVETDPNDPPSKYEETSACNCRARCSNNPPKWTSWYNRGRASSWSACNTAADRFCKSWTPPYHSYDASCD